MPLDLSRATPFQRRVLEVVRGKPRRGALRLGCRRGGVSRRFAGRRQRHGEQPVPLLVPCHRVVRNDGSTGSYAFGAGEKVRLLRSRGCIAGGDLRLALRRDADDRHHATLPAATRRGYSLRTAAPSAASGRLPRRVTGPARCADPWWLLDGYARPGSAGPPQRALGRVLHLYPRRRARSRAFRPRGAARGARRRGTLCAALVGRLPKLRRRWRQFALLGAVNVAIPFSS